MTADKIIQKAQSQIGVTEKPQNEVLYNTEYYGRAVNGSAYPWCCTFVWWVFKSLGASSLFYGGNKTASCTTLMNYHKQRNEFVTKDYQPGDLALFNWKGQKNIAQHIGIIESVGNGTVVTIEGNTSYANDTNGGTVMKRTRANTLLVGAVRPKYAQETDKIGEYEKLIVKGMGLTDPNRWMIPIRAAIEKDPYVETFYRKWAESYG